MFFLQLLFNINKFASLNENNRDKCSLRKKTAQRIYDICKNKSKKDEVPF